MGIYSSFIQYRMATRPVCSVYATADKTATVSGSAQMPAVFSAPIRDDIVSFCHSNMAKNRRQAHGVFHLQGHMHSAESWGTGRAVARIPRISGSGTSRAGQAAFGNMCRKGRMFAPLRTWRKWHRKINTNQKRHAVASCLAASACAPLVQARGHRCDNVPELPLVADINSAESTSALLKAINSVGCGDDLARVRNSKKMRNGQGKMRNSRFTIRKGPLIVYADEDSNVAQNSRNLPGVDSCNVNRLNLLMLAPGGHIGRFMVFTPSAFNALDGLFGTYNAASEAKRGFQLNRTSMECADLARIINSDQVQSKLRAIRTSVRAHDKTKKNPLNNRAMMQRMNPNAKAAFKAAQADKTKASAARAAALKERRTKAGKAAKVARTQRFNGLAAGLEKSFQDADAVLEAERKAGLIEDESEEEESDE